MAEDKPATAAAEKTPGDPPVSTKEPTRRELAEAEQATADSDAERHEALGNTEAANYRKAHADYQPITEPGEGA